MYEVEIFWDEVRIGAGKWGGDTCKIEMVILFSHRHLIGENSGYYNVKYLIVQLHCLPDLPF